MPKVSEQYREDRRRQILEAAVACFTRSGVHPTTMDDICRQAKLSRGAVYGYFESKDEIIRAVFASWERASLAVVEEASPQLGSGDVVETIGDRFAAPLAAKDERTRAALKLDLMMKAEAARDEVVRDAARRQAAAVMAPLEALFRSLQQRGAVDSELDPGQVVRVFRALLDGLKVQLIEDPDLDVAGFLRAMRAVVDLSPAARGSAP